MNPATPIIVLEGLIGLGVVVLLYVLHQREMRALRRAKESADPPDNPLVRTRDTNQAKLQEMDQEIAVRREALAALEAEAAAKAQERAQGTATHAQNANQAAPVVPQTAAPTDESLVHQEPPPADSTQAKTQESTEAPPR